MTEKFGELKQALAQCIGSECRYYRDVFGRRTGMEYTQGIKTFAEVGQAQWFIDMVNSHMPAVFQDFKATENFYYYVTLDVNNTGTSARFDIKKESTEREEYTDENNMVTVVTQFIPLTDLPRDKNSKEKCTTYKFYLFAEGYTVEDCKFILLLPSEN